ncbi:hypothetical protein G9C98_001256 [Cotesia typhae]|uniref:Telomere-associated protein Rif1 N-terminal domain-containing protein n=1 Tax=Cotesia typhae TaxID=2053667 RepID=A0A8J5UNR1_9HYME|nr:hypothetical protein G9C98_001256 [Cotesia typhae]
MTSTSLTPADVLAKLQGTIPSTDEIIILTYINSDNKRTNLLQIMTDNQYSDLCNLIINFMTSEQESCLLKKSDVKSLLNNIFNESSRKMPFFRLSLTVGRNKRLKIFDLIKTVEDKQLTRLVDDQDTFKFLNDCLRDVEASKMEWLSPTTCTDNISLLVQAEKKPTDFEDLVIYSTLEFIHRLYKHSLVNSNFNIRKFHQLVFDKVITLLYMGHKHQRARALDLFTTALKTDIHSYIRQNHEETWTVYRSNLQNVYHIRMLSLVKAGQPDWCRQWCLSVQALGTDLHRGADLINNLLSVEERAFKSPDMSIRIQAFQAWKLLIENFAIDPTQFAIPRRIKLLCIPLNANNNKTESIALAKFEVWRHLIIKLSFTPDKSLAQVIVQFLNFCFGPLGDTPLLSTKSGIQSSPGKRFVKARKCAVDSLLQLLASNPQDRALLFSELDQDNTTINVISQEMFQENFKSYIHSSGEACLLINDSEFVFENRETLNRILWQSLISLINKSTDELKPKMYQELILIICEVVNHIRIRDDCTSNLLLDIIIPELVKVSSHLLYRDQTLMDLLIRLLDPEFLKRPNAGLKTLLVHAIKPETITGYHPESLPFLKSVLSQMIALGTNVNLTGFVIEIWAELAELFVKFMDKESINEGTTLAHNFDTAYSLIIFPFKVIWINTNDVNQLIKISRCWKDLYAKFNNAADLITTVKTNEVLDHVAEDLLTLVSAKDNNKSYRFICYVFDALMNTIHYSDYLAVEGVPSLTSLLRDVTFSTLEQAEYVNEIECSLKAMASLLITIYGLEQDKAQFHLTVLRSCIEVMLKINVPECVKEVVNTWETVVIILKGLWSCLTTEFIDSYREALINALCHTNHEIAAQTMTFLDHTEPISEDVKQVLNEIELEALKKMGSLVKTDEGEKKHVRVAGSFLGRKSITKVSGGKKGKEKRVAPVPVPPEPDSQDYVLIQNDVKVNVNLLTEHQKECFKRHRDDIPAMYNDLSQSGSRNTQELEEWFKNKAGGSTEATDDNKENKHEKVKESEEIVGDTQELGPEAGDKIEEGSVTSIVKKLNFESRDEFPDENENTQDKDLTKLGLHPRDGAGGSRREGRGRRGRRRGGRGSRSTRDQDKGVKRKAVDSEEYADTKRRRHSAPTDLQSDSESFCSNESEKSPDGRTGVSQRTQKEMSRLKIDMVFDSRKMSKLRNKVSEEQKSKPTNDDFVYEKVNKRHSLDPNKLVKKTTRSSGDSLLVERQDLIFVRRKRKIDTKPQDPQSQDDSKVLSPMSSPSTSTTSNSTADEVVESSQDLCSVRSPRRERKTEKVEVANDENQVPEPAPTSVPTPASESPIKTDVPPESTKPEAPVKSESPVKSSQEVVKPTVDVKEEEAKAIFPSPKGIKRLTKPKLLTPGRGAQMLGLVTNLDMSETEDIKVSKVKPKDSEVPVLETLKKERAKDLGSPGGSRQRKIFSNMKTGDYTSSPPTKLFSNLKNDGEKISPKMEKVKDIGKTDHDYTELKETQIDLPMLEWSSANPPSLTASPSAGILKRRAVSALNHATLNSTSNSNVNVPAGNEELADTPKRKRVSFADPPVSKEMGYVVLPSSPGKLPKLLITRSFPGRKDTPLKIKLPKFKMIQTKEKPVEALKSDTRLYDINIEDREQEDVEVSIASQDIFQGDDMNVIVEEKKESVTPVVEEFGTQESTMARIMNGTVSQMEVGSINNINETLEDTVDVGNISNFTDDTIYKPVRTSTVEKINASDTLPVTSSIFDSQQSMDLSQSQGMEMTDPICPTLLGCTEPIDSIVDNLVHPVWSKNLSKLFTSKNINTVGDLAALSSLEYEKLPLKASGSPKVEHVRKVLTDFSMSLSTVPADREEIMDVDSLLIHSLIENVGTQPVVYNDDLNITEVLTDKIRITQEIEGTEEKCFNEFGSIILDNTLSPPKKSSTGMNSGLLNAVSGKKDVEVATNSVATDSKSVGVQMKLDELLDEIDVDLVLASGVKRSCPQSIITAYKAKMGTKNDAELGRETMHLLGMETYPDTCLKIACRDYGASKILGRLPDIFINDKEFFSKVLNTYRMKLTTSDLLSVADTDSVKQELCQKLTSIELCDMLARVLAEEEKREIKTPITDETCLNSILKRMPIDSVISHTVANDELIPSSVVLDIALQNNSPDIIAAALDSHGNNNSIKEIIVNKYLTSDKLLTHLGKKQADLSKEKIVDIYRSVCDKFTIEELLDLNNKIIKEKLKQLK